MTGRKRYARLVGYALLAVGTVLYLGPFLIQVANSLKTDPDAASHPLSLIPDPLSLVAWGKAFGFDTALDVPLVRWIVNSFVVTLSVTVGRLVIDSMAGYALARLRFPGRRAVTAGVLAVMAVPGVVLLIPKFLVLKQLGMFDSYSGMILPLLCDAVGIMLMKTAFEQVPAELEDAARIDGAGVLRTFAEVMVPLARPSLITVGILSFQGSWNELTHFLVATSDPKYQTLTLGIAQLTAGPLQGAQQFPLKLALATLSTIPVAVVYVVFQRHFVRNQVSSGIK
ncbi:carbohydrate ABC transporter permease [Actinocatenispora rupis]|uniref:Sugar ABC transporter permease n=1 Tax=Actinocatenispora rupis TaxID=519421 RepID=A0A8J3IXX8_9ACTN|nr:carbohydrate ABC transporter permease [Actinocatenispora rupis]GID10703.1 sugar ABC transporter permease [Actinocatenispora rupis]